MIGTRDTIEAFKLRVGLRLENKPSNAEIKVPTLPVIKQIYDEINGVSDYYANMVPSILADELINELHLPSGPIEESAPNCGLSQTDMKTSAYINFTKYSDRAAQLIEQIDDCISASAPISIRPWSVTDKRQYCLKAIDASEPDWNVIKSALSSTIAVLEDAARITNKENLTHKHRLVIAFSDKFNTFRLNYDSCWSRLIMNVDTRIANKY